MGESPSVGSQVHRDEENTLDCPYFEILSWSPLTLP